jgi:hypothetical protein
MALQHGRLQCLKLGNHIMHKNKVGKMKNNKKVVALVEGTTTFLTLQAVGS